MNRGIVYGLLGYASWGVFPLYFRQIASVGAVEVLALRIVFALAFLLVIVAAWRRWSWLAEVLRQPKVLLAFGASALLLSTNWATYIWSVTNGHVVDASLGYFMTPLVSVALGYVFLGERLRGPQSAALALALLGVVWLTVQGGQLPWIALILASSFGVYGLLRKIATLGALEGLTLETLILAPLALIGLGVLAARGDATFPAPDLALNLWLIGLGPTTAVPLLLFAAGQRRLSMATMGVLQYVSPSLQFMLGLWVFHEPFSAQRLVGFVLIWTALLFYSVDGWRASRRRLDEPAVVPG